MTQALNFPPFGSQTEGKNIPPEIAENVKRLIPAYMILVESRFRAVNKLIDSRKDRLIVDLPCGYTSRGIRMYGQGRRYFGFDLPAVIHDIKPAVESIIGSNKNITYQAVDATNYASLESAFTDEDHDLLITTEGLLMYFSQYELEEVFGNIHRLLQKYGGSWVTTDRAYAFCDRDVAHAALNNDAGLTAMFEAVTSKAAATAADVKFSNNVFFDADEEKVISFVEKMGFELKKIPMSNHLPEKFGSVSGSADVSVRKVFENMYFWELSVKNTRQGQKVNDKAFSVQTKQQGGTLQLFISGRLDTLTAPELLKKFQEAQQPIEAIELHVDDMSYISSAGLRILLIMYKSLEDKSKFKMLGVSESVRDIIQTTGFDSVFF
ncbi:MAG: anti-sigma factor antagonist [Firmicutes bacterium]|nr:anti-sigma factor antagonist [Bacillota bacterium]